MCEYVYECVGACMWCVHVDGVGVFVGGMEGRGEERVYVGVFR